SAKRISDRIAMLYGGRMIWVGPTRDVDDSGNAYVNQFIHGLAEGPIALQAQVR
ncbi:MAG: ABC transporter ATP-binding protein, partial [Kiloniellales bacterium]|nr:ABC transporter ATP-binding protein [Kiloniellales bacterium]